MQMLATPDAARRWQPKDAPEKFRATQRKAGLTNDALAERLGVSRRTVYYYRSGVMPLPYPVQFCLEQLAKAER